MNKSVVIKEYDGVKIVEINSILFRGKRRIDWDGVEDYLKQYIGKCYRIAELVQSLSEIKHFTNCDDRHASDAPNGWYRGTVNFSLPITDDKGHIIGKNIFRGRMVIRCNSDNKLYLYDIVTIKKKCSTPHKHPPYGSV